MENSEKKNALVSRNAAATHIHKLHFFPSLTCNERSNRYRLHAMGQRVHFIRVSCGWIFIYSKNAKHPQLNRCVCDGTIINTKWLYKLSLMTTLKMCSWASVHTEHTHSLSRTRNSHTPSDMRRNVNMESKRAEHAKTKSKWTQNASERTNENDGISNRTDKHQVKTKQIDPIVNYDNSNLFSCFLPPFDSVSRSLTCSLSHSLSIVRIMYFIYKYSSQM